MARTQRALQACNWSYSAQQHPVAEAARQLRPEQDAHELAVRRGYSLETAAVREADMSPAGDGYFFEFDISSLG
jgi:hypothetical protein